MKKLNKKQKIIGFIAILLVAIILAIIITTNIISNNNQVASEGYFATTANAGSALVASYIKNGITIGGITGTLEVLDTSDATATAEDIAYGKTAYVDGEKITGTRIPNNNYTFTDSLGNTIKVPRGFEVVNPEDNVTDGIIIEDINAGDENTKGSQFVWIPVGEVKTDNNGSTTTITLGRYTFSSNGEEKLVQSAENGGYENETIIRAEQFTSSYYYRELLKTSSSTNSKAKDIADFATKTLASGGYYIGRYEAGDAYAIDSSRVGTWGTSNNDNPIACKAGIYPYNYINQPDASSLCQEMYDNSDFESDLINSFAWDTAIVFIQNFSGDTDYSQQIGRNTMEKIQKCGESILDYVDERDEAHDVRCNIYDMAGNTQEWSTESLDFSAAPAVLRGGFYDQDDEKCAGGRDATNYGSAYLEMRHSARPILYL